MPFLRFLDTFWPTVGIILVLDIDKVESFYTFYLKQPLNELVNAPFPILNPRQKSRSGLLLKMSWCRRNGAIGP